jgi:hypothetical protein
MNPEIDSAQRALRTPRAAAISGIAFSVLLIASLVLLRLAVPGNLSRQNTWLSEPSRRLAVLVALNLVPFSGIAFLWFIGVVRDRMGQREDRFFATVFLGSGILFVAMVFVATALAVGVITTAASSSDTPQALATWQVDLAVTYTLVTTYAMRMAAVFTIATATITLRIAIMPRWLALLGYACALVLLISVGYLPWVELLFPAWVLVVSTYILMATFHNPRAQEERHGPAGDPAPS